MKAHDHHTTIRRLLDLLGNISGAFTVQDKHLAYADPEAARVALQKHSLDVMAYSACNMGKDLWEMLEKTFWEESVFQTGLMAELTRIQQHFGQIQVTPIVLKGFSLSRYYPKGYVRPMSDIDLLVRVEDIRAGLSMLEDMGYRYFQPEKVDQLLADYGEIDLFQPLKKIKVELHWDFISSKSLRRAASYQPDYVFSRAVSYETEGLIVHVLPPYLDLAYLMAHHVLHHQFQRALWLLDVLLILKTTEIDWPEFESAVVQLGIVRPVHYYINAILKIAGLTEFSDLDLESLKHRLAPRCLRYYLFSGFKKPRDILKKRGKLRKFNDLMFRNAFK